MTRSVIDKLLGIKSNIVRGHEGWQDWGLAQHVKEMKVWRDINPCNEESGKEKGKRKDISDKVFNTGRRNTVVYIVKTAITSHTSVHMLSM